jgi:uncharacterized protein (UPF0333 family)
MKLRSLPSSPTVTLGLLGVVAWLIIVLFVLTGQHNAQLQAQTEVLNAQLVQQTQVHNAQLVQQAEVFNPTQGADGSL